MAVRKINESTLTAIGNAIRSKTGGSALIKPEDMASEIESISTGGGENVTIGKKGTITLSEDVIRTTINHGLGKVPFLITVFPTNNYTVTGMKVVGAWYFNGSGTGILPFVSTPGHEVGYYATNKLAYNANASTSGSGYYVENVTQNAFDFVGTDSGHLPQNVELTWYAVALNDTGG